MQIPIKTPAAGVFAYEADLDAPDTVDDTEFTGDTTSENVDADAITDVNAHRHGYTSNQPLLSAGRY